jgi:hypothetical protein
MSVLVKIINSSNTKSVLVMANDFDTLKRKGNKETTIYFNGSLYVYFLIEHDRSQLAIIISVFYLTRFVHFNIAHYCAKLKKKYVNFFNFKRRF